MAQLLQNVMNGESLAQQVERLTRELAEAKQAKGKSLSCKVSEKGGLSVYGLGRFPVSLYRGQWERLIAFVPEITAFIEANADRLSVKE